MALPKNKILLLNEIVINHANTCQSDGRKLWLECEKLLLFHFFRLCLVSLLILWIVALCFIIRNTSGFLCFFFSISQSFFSYLFQMVIVMRRVPLRSGFKVAKRLVQWQMQHFPINYSFLILFCFNLYRSIKHKMWFHVCK